MNTLILGIFTALLFVIALGFIVPSLRQIRRTRLPREFTDLSRDERVSAMTFFYALPEAKLAEVRALPDRRQKDAALRAAYVEQNPEAPQHEAFSVVATFIKLYAGEIGLRGGLYHKRADGNVVLGASAVDPTIVTEPPLSSGTGTHAHNTPSPDVADAGADGGSTGAGGSSDAGASGGDGGSGGD